MEEEDICVVSLGCFDKGGKSRSEVVDIPVAELLWPALRIPVTSPLRGPLVDVPCAGAPSGFGAGEHEVL